MFLMRPCFLLFLIVRTRGKSSVPPMVVANEAAATTTVVVVVVVVAEDVIANDAIRKGTAWAKFAMMCSCGEEFCVL